MSKQNHFIKKQLSILIIGMMCITSTISGYAAEKLENDSVKARAVTSISKISKDADGMITSGKWKCSNGIVIELTNNVLTISGKGKINEEARKIISSTICASDKYKVNCIVENGITMISNDLFVGCLGLNNIEIPNSVIDIGSGAFQACKNLKSIKIPDSVKSIGTYAFWSCESLISIEIPTNVTNIGEEIFRDCSSLSSIKVATDNRVYDSRNNCNAIINTSTNELIVGCINTKIPSGVTSIGNGAFRAGCPQNIDIPASVTIIGGGAFDCCNNLESIKIPNSVTVIGMAAFRACNNLRSIEIPSSVTDIGRWAFSGCYNLKKITNYSSVELELEQHNDKGQWYLENTNTIVTKIANGQTAVYKKIGEDGKPIDDVKYGDINLDGDINVQDGVLIKKYLAGIKGTNYNEEALDVNADGIINTSDAVILLKYLAGINVKIGK